ncbi:MAG: hypothetical protein M1820_003645, partial [Bogoriella megaspora]
MIEDLADRSVTMKDVSVDKDQGSLQIRRVRDLRDLLNIHRFLHTLKRPLEPAHSFCFLISSFHISAHISVQYSTCILDTTLFAYQAHAPSPLRVQC